MTSYLVLEAPEGPGRDPMSTRFIADRFAWLAFIAPWIWLAVNRLWLAALGVFALQVAAGLLSVLPGFGGAGTFIGLAVALIVAFEGRDLLMRKLTAKGWRLASVISAPDLAAAEQLYFADAAPARRSLPEPRGSSLPKTMPGFPPDDAAVAFQFDFNGRR